MRKIIGRHWKCKDHSNDLTGCRGSLPQSCSSLPSRQSKILSHLRRSRMHCPSLQRISLLGSHSLGRSVVSPGHTWPERTYTNKHIASYSNTSLLLCTNVKKYLHVEENDARAVKITSHQSFVHISLIWIELGTIVPYNKGDQMELIFIFIFIFVRG